MKDVCNRIIPLALEKCQSCGCHVTLMLLVEIKCLEGSHLEAMAEKDEKMQLDFLGWLQPRLPLSKSHTHTHPISFKDMPSDISKCLSKETLETVSL